MIAQSLAWSEQVARVPGRYGREAETNGARPMQSRDASATMSVLV
jgi:hypothetical protein